MASLSDGGGLNVEYKYNDAGIRTQKTVNGVTTNYHLAGDRVTYETNGTDEIYYTYDSVGDLVGFTLNGVDYYYIRNAQNDIIGIFDNTGAKVVSYIYDSWGKLISIDDDTEDHVGLKNPYRYRGYRFDTETSLYYLQSRYYNPEWGRFLNADALAGEKGVILSHNLFAYCKNNPVNYCDPSGAIVIPAILGVGVALLFLKAVLYTAIVIVAVAAIAGVIDLLNAKAKSKTKAKAKEEEGQAKQEKQKTKPATKPPDIKYPGNDPKQPPGPGYEWRGGPDKGSWYRPDTKEVLRPDLEHKPPIGPHWDYRDPSGTWWRIFPDGNITSNL